MEKELKIQKYKYIFKQVANLCPHPCSKFALNPSYQNDINIPTSPTCCQILSISTTLNYTFSSDPGYQFILLFRPYSTYLKIKEYFLQNFVFQTVKIKVKVNKHKICAQVRKMKQSQDLKKVNSLYVVIYSHTESYLVIYSHTQAYIVMHSHTSYIVIQAQLGVPHSRIQVELGFILHAETCKILNFAQGKLFKAQN